MTRIMLFTFLVGCATPTTPETLSAREATLTEGGKTGDATRAWYQSLSGLSYEAYRPIAGIDRLHHLDVMDYVTGDAIVFEPGRRYVDGPAVNGRGPLGAWVLADGTVNPAAPRPWIDVVTCDGDIYEGAAHCRTAERTELSVEDVGPTEQRVTYRSTMPGESAPTVEGSFVMVPGHRN